MNVSDHPGKSIRPEPRASTWPLFLLLIVALLGGVAYLLWWSLQPPALRTVRLRSGYRITLSAVTYGVVHQYDPAPPLNRLLRLVKLANPVPDAMTLSTPTPEVRLWVTHVKPESRRGEDAIVECFEDVHSCHFGPGSSSRASGFTGGYHRDKQPPIAIRYGRPFDYVGYYENSGEEAYRFHVEPPPLDTFPKLAPMPEPRPLPQSVRTKDVSATLASLSAASEPEPHSRAVINAFDGKGRRLSVVSLSLQDGYGARTVPLGRGDRAYLTGKGFPVSNLCLYDPAWKLLATLAPEPGGGVAPDALWDFKNVPTGGQPSTLVRASKKIEVSVIRTPRSPSPESRLVDLVATAEGMTTPCRLAVLEINGEPAANIAARFAKRNRGAQNSILVTEVSPETDWWGQFRVPVAGDARSIRIQIAEYAGRNVEFVVRPPTGQAEVK